MPPFHTALRAAFVLLAMALPSAAWAAPRVVASIPPVHSLIAGVMDGVGIPDLLVGPTASAHTYSLRPSEARLLQQAELVFWIGPVYETFLEKPLGALSAKAKIVRLADAPGIGTLPARRGGPWDAHAHDGHDHGHDHAHGAKGKADAADGHLFLDPENAKAMVRAAAATLASADPVNAARYRGNAEAVLARLDGLDAELRAMLTPVRDKPFIVFHDAYQYLEKRYALNAVGSITVSPERQPGAQRLQRLRRKITQSQAVCVFAEPQFEPTLVQTVIERTQAKTGVLDYMGVANAPGRDAYFETMRGMARALAGCLQG
jgi:zinc transport system substrate-binding protein